MTLKEIIDEITHYKNPSKHKSALDIFNLLDNNSALFLQKTDPVDFSGLLKGFEDLAYAGPGEYATAAYKNEYDKMYGLLLYHLNKIV